MWLNASKLPDSKYFLRPLCQNDLIMTDYTLLPNTQREAIAELLFVCNKIDIYKIIDSIEHTGRIGKPESLCTDSQNDRFAGRNTLEPVVAKTACER